MGRLEEELGGEEAGREEWVSRGGGFSQRGGGMS